MDAAGELDPPKYSRTLAFLVGSFIVGLGVALATTL
jgi:hypothetical protein